jgi:hypothetical protein
MFTTEEHRGTQRNTEEHRGTQSCHSRECRMKGLSNFVAIKNFHTRYLVADNIKDDHSFGWAEFYVAVIAAVTSFRSRLSIKRCTKIISTTTAINNGQSMYLC